MIVPTLRPELRDLRRVASVLRDALGDRVETSFLRGKTRMRNTLMDRMGCSEMEAETIVEQLQRLSYVQVERGSAGRTTWMIHHEPGWLN